MIKSTHLKTLTCYSLKISSSCIIGNHIVSCRLVIRLVQTGCEAIWTGARWLWRYTCCFSHLSHTWFSVTSLVGLEVFKIVAPPGHYQLTQKQTSGSAWQLIGGGGASCFLELNFFFPTGSVTSWPEKRRTWCYWSVAKSRTEPLGVWNPEGKDRRIVTSPASATDSSGVFCLGSDRAPRCLITVSPACPQTDVFSSSFSTGHFCLSCSHWTK